MIALQDVYEKYKKKNQVLFTRESACLQELLACIRRQSHRTMVLWAFACTEEIVTTLKQRCPEDTRPETALKLCRAWAAGEIKMPAAKKAILAVHAAAKETENPAENALYHAVGHGCATVHVETHAIGLPMYELTAIVREFGPGRCEKQIADKLAAYMQKLHLCAQKAEAERRPWAAFVSGDSSTNRERHLFEQQAKKVAAPD